MANTRPECRADESDDIYASPEDSDPVPEQLRLLADDHAQAILAALAGGPRAGRELAELCDISRPTVYRRLNRLEAAGFVSTEMSPDLDGHHRKEFYLLRDRLTVTVEAGAITVTAHPSGPNGQ